MTWPIAGQLPFRALTCRPSQEGGSRWLLAVRRPASPRRHCEEIAEMGPRSRVTHRPFAGPGSNTRSEQVRTIGKRWRIGALCTLFAGASVVRADCYLEQQCVCDNAGPGQDHLCPKERSAKDRPLCRVRRCQRHEPDPVSLARRRLVLSLDCVQPELAFAPLQRVLLRIGVLRDGDCRISG